MPPEAVPPGDRRSTRSASPVERDNTKPYVTSSGRTPLPTCRPANRAIESSKYLQQNLRNEDSEEEESEASGSVKEEVESNSGNDTSDSGLVDGSASGSDNGSSNSTIVLDSHYHSESENYDSEATQTNDYDSDATQANDDDSDGQDTEHESAPNLSSRTPNRSSSSSLSSLSSLTPTPSPAPETGSGSGSGSSSQFSCRYCSRTYDRQAPLTQHIEDRHCGTRCYFPGCGEKFETEGGLLKHFRDHQKEGLDIGLSEVTCPWPECGIEYSRRDTVQRCIKRHNRQAPRGV
ncbi:hypothetical protein F5Y09DRAFT_354268 [Xylaria sp. FL1042]|nr:hypothetical protein F5Y09DRAFT_354268 [Xylaria sp. FL1042]